MIFESFFVDEQRRRRTYLLHYVFFEQNVYYAACSEYVETLIIGKAEAYI